MGKRIIALLVLLLVASSAWGMLPGFNSAPLVAGVPNPYTIHPSSVGAANGWNVNTGTALDAVATNDGDTTYLYETGSYQYQSFTHDTTEIPITATINYVKIVIVARSVGTATDLNYIGPRFRVGGTWYLTWNDFTPTINTGYQEVSYTSTSNPVTALPWTVSDINSLDWGFSTDKADVEHRITYAALEIGWAQ